MIRTPWSRVVRVPALRGNAAVPGRGRRRSAVQTTMRQESHRHRVSPPRCLDGYRVGSPCSVAVLNSVRADSAQAHLSRWAWAEPDRLPGHRQSGPGLRADPGSRPGANLLPRSQGHDITLALVTDPCLLPALRVPFQI